jgi:hypothetical protein
VNLSDYGAADDQIQNMQKALENPDSEKVKPLLHAAFGEVGKNYDLAKVQDTVSKLAEGNLKASIPEVTDRDFFAATRYPYDEPTDTYSPGHAEFGSRFHGKS